MTEAQLVDVPILPPPWALNDQKKVTWALNSKKSARTEEYQNDGLSWISQVVANKCVRRM